MNPPTITDAVATSAAAAIRLRVIVAEMLGGLPDTVYMTSRASLRLSVDLVPLHEHLGGGFGDLVRRIDVIESERRANTKLVARTLGDDASEAKK